MQQNTILRNLSSIYMIIEAEKGTVKEIEEGLQRKTDIATIAHSFFSEYKRN